jgi:hypothetical protein
MDQALSWRAVVIGHLVITVPTIAAILLMEFLGLSKFGPSLSVYYVLGGITIGWQWSLFALRSWKTWLSRKDVKDEEVEQLARRTFLVWPGEATIGPFALHTAAAAVVGLHFGPWLLSRWFAWMPPLAGISARTPTVDDYLQHFELASIVPAFIVGYILSRHFRGLATCAWILPTVILAYKLLAYSEPYSSILAPHPSSRFACFFAMQRTMPPFGSDDAVRLVQQMFVLAPFSAGAAYSIGALASRKRILETVFENSPDVSSDDDLNRPPVVWCE